MTSEIAIMNKMAIALAADSAVTIPKEKQKGEKIYNTVNKLFTLSKYHLLVTVAVLPKEELATMAEALVNLIYFRQKVTMESETVGGPVDVAIISKGDGFIWIKRKHYFKAELNPHFFANYYRTDKNQMETENEKQ